MNVNYQIVKFEFAFRASVNKPGNKLCQRSERKRTGGSSLFTLGPRFGKSLKFAKRLVRYLTFTRRGTLYDS